jgi:hypothetical protein
MPGVATRASRALALRYRMLQHRGDAVICPVCGNHFAVFRDDFNRPNAICWRCGSQERHRALWLYLERHPESLTAVTKLLHFAPEWCLERRLRAVRHLQYVTADLDPAKGQMRLDITRLELPDRSFDAILCSHVLEHVEDDRAAIGELYRVLAPGGWAIVMVPLDLGRSETYENPDVCTPHERERHFWQFDHVRLYAPDIAERLAAPGFEVTRESWVQDLGPEVAKRYGLLEVDEIFVCRRPTVD